MARKKAAKETAKKAAKKTTRKTAARKATTARARTKLTDKDKTTIRLIDSTAQRIYASIGRRVLPELKFPVRALSNVSYDKKTGYLQIGKGRKARALSVNTARSFAQTLRLMSFSKEMVENDEYATKREAYYISKNWGDCKFREQPESDAVMDDIEALASLDGLSREQLRYRPEEHGGALAGELTVIDKGDLRIDCTRMGSGAYTIPSSVEHLRFETKAKFVLVIETAGMFGRLNDHEYWRKSNCILINMGGVPSRAQRRFIRRLSEDKRLPVYCFVDCDPYGIANIYRTLKVGSGNAAHINQFFCVPKAQYLGLTPQDIVDFDLKDATHELLAVDVKRAKDALKNDPFFKSYPAWKRALEQLLKMGVRAEQQSLAKHGLNFVMEEYLPAKLKNKKSFLP